MSIWPVGLVFVCEVYSDPSLHVSLNIYKLYGVSFQLVNEQASYHKRALEALEEVLPKMNAQLGFIICLIFII